MQGPNGIHKVSTFLLSNVVQASARSCDVAALGGLG